MTRRGDARKLDRRSPPDDIADPTKSEAVVEALPSVRRYAGALTGSTDSGDRSHFVADLRTDDDAVSGGNQLQQEAWQAARLTMSRSLWSPGSLRTPGGSLQRDAPPDLDDQPGQRQGPLAPGRARTRDGEGGRKQQREALEVWETEGGAAAPGNML